MMLINQRGKCYQYYFIENYTRMFCFGAFQISITKFLLFVQYMYIDDSISKMDQT